MQQLENTVLICGAGQLGSRYLQGLSKSIIPLNIYVQDIFKDSLLQAEERWNETVGDNTSHSVFFYESLENIPKNINIAIISTTAEVRASLVVNIRAVIDVGFWILEKVLAQNEADLEIIYKQVKECSGAWINTPRRMMSWHQQIKKSLYNGTPVNLEVKGGDWGLACNAIHLIDLVAWWTGESLQSVDVSGLNSEWFESKRKGYWEINGTLEACFSKGSSLKLTSESNNNPVTMIAHEQDLSWHINEIDGVAKCSNGEEIVGRLQYQSEITAQIIESIINEGRCSLPTIDESISQHRVFLKSLQQHWDRASTKNSDSVPIT